MDDTVGVNGKVGVNDLGCNIVVEDNNFDEFVIGDKTNDDDGVEGVDEEGVVEVSRKGLGGVGQSHKDCATEGLVSMV